MSDDVTSTDHGYRIDAPERLDEHGSQIVTEIENVEVSVVNVRGEYHAVPNVCPHVGGPLGEGSLTGYTDLNECDEIVYDDTENVIECPWHTRRFDVASGENIDDPQFQIPTFDVSEIDGEIYVSV